MNEQLPVEAPKRETCTGPGVRKAFKNEVTFEPGVEG